jgi:hypothetical protein
MSLAPVVVIVAVVAAIGAAVAKNLPEVKRYLKVRAM